MAQKGFIDLFLDKGLVITEGQPLVVTEGHTLVSLLVCNASSTLQVHDSTYLYTFFLEF